MIKEIVRTIEYLVHVPSPSGYTKRAIETVEQLLEETPFRKWRDRKGGLFVEVPGHNDERRRLLTAHVDTLGAMVKEVKPSGRLSLSMIGGFNWNAVEGEYCTVHVRKGGEVTGTIVMHETSVHVYRNSGDLPRNETHMEVRLDAVTRSQEETEALGIRPGDFVSFDPSFECAMNGFVKSRHLDDKASVALLVTWLRAHAKRGAKLPHTTLVYFSTNEEIGYGGNSNIDPSIEEYVAVDMGAIGDGQATDEYSVSICVKDSSGPYHYELTNELENIARRENIDYVVDIYPYYGSDASAAMRAGADVRHALFGPGIESSHALERTHERSLQATYALIEAYTASTMIE